MPFIDPVDGLDPKLGLELAFTNKALMAAISKEAAHGGSLPMDALADYVARWLEAILSVDVDSRLAGTFKVKKIIAMNHQQEDVCPYYKAFNWQDIEAYDYGKNNISSRNIRVCDLEIGDDFLDTDGSSDDWDGLAGRIRISYEGPQSALWHWDITLDHGCFEIQTCPTKLSDFNSFAFNIVQHHIMACAERIGLNDWSGQGGTQINVDFDTGLAENYLMILRVIAATERKRGQNKALKRVFGGVSLALDGPPSFNAAYIKDEDRPGALRGELGELIAALTERYRQQPDGLEREEWHHDFFRVYRYLLRKYPTDGQILQLTPKKTSRRQIEQKVTLEEELEEEEDERKRNAPYNEEIERFQALNVTNILDVKESLRRVEFRDYFALYQIEDLGAALTVVYGILLEARGRHLRQEKEFL